MHHAMDRVRMKVRVSRGGLATEAPLVVHTEGAAQATLIEVDVKIIRLVFSMTTGGRKITETRAISRRQKVTTTTIPAGFVTSTVIILITAPRTQVLWTKPEGRDVVGTAEAEVLAGETPVISSRPQYC